MLIPINIPPSSDSNPKLPPTLAKISHDEVVLIELQGTLDIEDHGSQANRDGQFVGTFSMDDAGKKPTLMIGSHLLEGKIVSLPKPLAILHRSHFSTSSAIPQTDLHPPDSDSDTHSPTSKRIRLQTTESQSQSQSSHNPHITSHTMDTQFQYTETQAPLLSSSSASSFSRSDPTTTHNSNTGTAIIPPTWNMIAIIKKKIVFSKRPMPIIHKP